MRPAAFILASFLLLFSLQGCSTTGEVVRSKGTGTSIVYPVSRDQAWDIVKAVFRWEGAEDIEEHSAKNYIVASRGSRPFSENSVACAWVEPVDSEDTMITVVTKNKRSLESPTNFTQTAFLWRFGQAVEIMKEGKALPSTPPE
jgi:hypothetical protein